MKTTEKIGKLLRLGLEEPLLLLLSVLSAMVGRVPKNRPYTSHAQEEHKRFLLEYTGNPYP